MKITVLLNESDHLCCGDEIVIGATGRWWLKPFRGSGHQVHGYWSGVNIDRVAIWHNESEPNRLPDEATVVAIRGITLAFGQPPKLTDLAKIASGLDRQELDDVYDEYLVDLDI